jgi:hypothetical protein
LTARRRAPGAVAEAIRAIRERLDVFEPSTLSVAYGVG